MNSDIPLMSADYYQVGGSLPPEYPSYVKRKADEDLYQGLKNGDFCCVFNSRQMGKSSLRVQVRKQLENKGIKCTSIDMTRIGSSDPNIESFYAGITYELWDGFFEDVSTFDAWWKQHEILAPLQRLSQFIEKVLLTKLSTQIIIFIDELDNLINRETKDEFLEFIRACYDKRADTEKYNRITFCLLGVVTPSDLKDQQGAPFNIGKVIELTGFKFEEVQSSLTMGLVDKVDSPERVIKEVLSWTGGQPFLTQKLCKLIIEKAENQQPNIDDLVKNYIIDNWEYQDEPEHLRTIKNRLLVDKNHAYKLLKVYEEILQDYESDTADNPEKMALRLSGLVVKHQGVWQVYNNIYKQVFSQDWIEKVLDVLLEDPDNNSQIKFKNRNFLSYGTLSTIAIILVIISGMSLGFSYTVFQSPAWSHAYNKNGTGAIIEFLRTCFLLTLEVYVIGSEFRESTYELLGEKKFSLRRKTTYFFTLMLFIMLLYHHLWDGPHQLLGNNKVSQNEYFYHYLLPYICYFPYSLINFLFIGIISSSLSINLVIEDCKKLSKKIKEYKNYLDDITRKIAGKYSSPDTEKIENKINNSLNQIYLEFTDRIKPHINLFSGFLIFQATLDINSFSVSAYTWTQLFFVFGFITPVTMLILWGLLAYNKSLDKTLGVLFRLNLDTAKVEKKYSTFKLLAKVLISNFLFRIVSTIYIFQIIYLILLR